MRERVLSNSFELNLTQASFNYVVKSRSGPIQLIENINVLKNRQNYSIFLKIYIYLTFAGHVLSEYARLMYFLEMWSTIRRFDTVEAAYLI